MAFRAIIIDHNKIKEWNLDPRRIQQIMIKMEIPPNRWREMSDKIWMLWADRVEEMVQAQEAQGFPHVRRILQHISRGK